jgi:hypothetical protein
MKTHYPKWLIVFHDVESREEYEDQCSLIKEISDDGSQDSLILENGYVIHCASPEKTRSEVQRITQFLTHNDRNTSSISYTTGIETFSHFFTRTVLKAAEGSGILKSFEIVSREHDRSLFIDVKKLKLN